MSSRQRHEHHAEHARELQATPEQVWDAIATAEGISTWMVPAQLEPKVGGEVSFDQGGFRSTGTITRFDAPIGFSYEEPWPMTDGMRAWVAETAGHTVTDDEVAALAPIATEFLIEAASGGTCVLRVVSSSFGSGADWEKEYFENMVAGWGDVPFGPDHDEPWLDRLTAYLRDLSGVRA